MDLRSDLAIRFQPSAGNYGRGRNPLLVLKSDWKILWRCETVRELTTNRRGGGSRERPRGVARSQGGSGSCHGSRGGAVGTDEAS